MALDFNTLQMFLTCVDLANPLDPSEFEFPRAAQVAQHMGAFIFFRFLCFVPQHAIRITNYLDLIKT